MMQDYNVLENEYNKYKEMNLKLDMTRGKPSAEQLDTAEKLLQAIKGNEGCFTENSADGRNYSPPTLLAGIPEAKKLFAEILGVKAENIVVGGNSSLNMMFDVVSQCVTHGATKNGKPWGKYDKVSFLCPVPGYDRHFAITEYFGINMINIPMDSNGPDMDLVEKLVAQDETIKGMWCNPKYSNPTGITFSAEVVTRLAKMQTKAEDFRIFWDNAYAVHDLEDETEELKEIFAEAEKYGNQDRIFEFASTSKITHAGAGICCVAVSENNVKWLLGRMKFQTIGTDKLNQIRHAKIFKTFADLKKQMDAHKEIIKPKFEVVDQIFSKELKDLQGVSWTKPKGGYFITLYLPKGCATKIVDLAAQAGLTLTPAGATHPYKKDEDDSVIRIAPTFPPKEDVERAAKLMCLCVKLVLTQMCKK